MSIQKQFKRLFRIFILNFISKIGIYPVLRFVNRKKPIVLVYHDILEKVPEGNNYKVTISTSKFHQQIKYLNQRYNFISLNQFIDWKINNAGLPNNPLLLTFDDGHINNYFAALKILNKYNIKGVFFIKTGFLGTYNENYFEELINILETDKTKNNLISKIDYNRIYNNFRNLKFKNQISLIQTAKKESQKIESPRNEMKFLHMDEKMCKELIRQGHSVQSHSVNHFILSSLSNSDSQIELNDSFNFINNKFNRTLAIAYPFGDPNYDVGIREYNFAKDIGYKLGFIGEVNESGQFINKKMYNYSLPRFGMVNVDFKYFQMLLSGIRIKK